MWFSTAALACLVVVLVWVDSTVFGLYRFHLNGMVWELLTEGAAADVLPITRATWIRGWMTVSGLVALEFTLAFLAWTWVRREATRGGGWRWPP